MSVRQELDPERDAGGSWNPGEPEVFRMVL